MTPPTIAPVGEATDGWVVRVEVDDAAAAVTLEDATAAVAVEDVTVAVKEVVGFLELDVAAADGVETISAAKKSVIAVAAQAMYVY